MTFSFVRSVILIIVYCRMTASYLYLLLMWLHESASFELNASHDSLPDSLVLVLTTCDGGPSPTDVLAVT